MSTDNDNHIDEPLSSFMQENVLTLLCMDKNHYLQIRSIIDHQNFDNDIYQVIAQRAIKFIDSYKEPPMDHLADLLDDKLNSSKQNTARMYNKIVSSIYEGYETINVKYVTEKLQEFVEEQTFKAGILTAVKSLKGGNLDQAKVVMDKALKTQVNTFNGGIDLFDDKQFSYLDDQTQGYHTDIKGLDDYGVSPCPGELFTILAGTGKGKTWMMIHMAKSCIQQRKKVLHITLEMSEAKTMMRYHQSFFAIAKKSKEYERTVLELDELGRFSSFEKVILKPKSFQDTDIKEHIKEKIRKTFKGNFLKIKQFPTGSLTTLQLESYLEQLERVEGFVPDVIVVDYADLMKLDARDIRGSTGQVYKDLRGIAVDRNVAMITASQSNRAGAGVKIITSQNFAEDYSKAAISDNIITYNQTEDEKELNIARIFVAKGRNERDGYTVIISQHYGTGQFCLENAEMEFGDSRYWDTVDGSANGDDDDKY